jgi:hypothetical protein
MKRLRIDYLWAVGDPQRRYAINREFIALAFEMKAAGVSRASGRSPGCARWHEVPRLIWSRCYRRDRCRCGSTLFFDRCFGGHRSATAAKHSGNAKAPRPRHST